MKIEQIEQFEQARELAFKCKATELEKSMWLQVNNILSKHKDSDILKEDEYLKLVKDIHYSLNQYISEDIDLKQIANYFDGIFPNSYAGNDRVISALMGYFGNLKKKLIKTVWEAFYAIENKKDTESFVSDLKKRAESEIEFLGKKVESFSNDLLTSSQDFIKSYNDIENKQKKIEVYRPDFKKYDINKAVRYYEEIKSRADKLLTYSKLQENIKKIIIEYCDMAVKTLKGKGLYFWTDYHAQKRGFRHIECHGILNILENSVRELNDEKLIQEILEYIDSSVFQIGRSILYSKLRGAIAEAEKFEIFSLRVSHKHRNLILEEKIKDMKPQLMKEKNDSAESKNYVKNFDSKKSDNLSLRTQLKATKESLAIANVELVSLRSAKELLNTELKKTKESLDKANNKIKEYDADLEKLKAGNELLRSALTITESSLNKANQKIETHTTELRVLNENFNAFKSSREVEKASHLQEKDQYRKQIEDLLGVQADYKSFKSKADEMDQLLIALRGQLNSSASNTQYERDSKLIQSERGVITNPSEAHSSSSVSSEVNRVSGSGAGNPITSGSSIIPSSQNVVSSNPSSFLNSARNNTPPPFAKMATMKL